jgi:hypothetical protein
MDQKELPSFRMSCRQEGMTVTVQTLSINVGAHGTAKPGAHCTDHIQGGYPIVDPMVSAVARTNDLDRGTHGAGIAPGPG